MIKIASLDANNKVIGVYLLSDAACRNKETGEITMESCDEAADKLWGEGKYVADLTPETRGSPNPGFNYDPVNRVFFEDKPKDPDTGQEFTSWQLNIEKGIWESPQIVTVFDNMIMMRWNETTQKWKAKKGSETKLNDNSNWYVWNPISKTWENTNSSVY